MRILIAAKAIRPILQPHRRIAFALDDPADPRLRTRRRGLRQTRAGPMNRLALVSLAGLVIHGGGLLFGHMHRAARGNRAASGNGG